MLVRSGMSKHARFRGPSAVVAGLVAAALGLALLEAPPAAATPTTSVTPVMAAAKTPPLITERDTERQAAGAAQAPGPAVEVLAGRTAESQTFANPDGTFTTKSYSGPVRAQDAKGAWHDIDTTLSD